VLTSQLLEHLQIEYPIIQAPMAGGITTTSLVTEVSKHGGLGMIGAGYMSPAQLEEQIKETKAVVKNFGVNLFVPSDFSVTEDEVLLANEAMKPILEKLVVEEEHSELPTKEKALQNFNEQVTAVLKEKVPVCSFTFGLPTEEMIKELKKNGIFLIGTATTVKEAVEIERLGMDAAVVQGSEAGGHRGNFLSEDENSSIGLMSLIPQVVDAIAIPVIAAGGIMDGRGLAASLCLGAKAVQMGTAFLATEESGASILHKEEILKATEEEIVATKSFSGKWAQGIHNAFMEEMREYEARLPSFPVQNALTQPIRKAATKQKDKDYMSLWSGQSPRLAKNQSAKALIEHTMREARDIIEKK